MAYGTPPAPFPVRPRDAHKGSVGTVLVVAGSAGMTGAAYLAGQAALRSGAGLVTVAGPRAVQAAVSQLGPCLLTRVLPETEAGTLAEDALEPLLELAAGKDALALGPGLSRHPETERLVRALPGRLPAAAPRLVLDADALNAWEGQPEGLAPLAGRAVLTPHPGEFRRLAGEAAGGPREQALAGFVARVGVTTLLKGHATLVAEPGRLATNETGNPGMATAGSGDVLTGVIAALLAAGLTPWEAATLGAWLHGRAGDVAAQTRGWAGLIATDLLEALPAAIRPLEEAPR